MMLVAAVDLLVVFLGLEIDEHPVYVLAGFDRRDLRSNESALKYFLVGSFASALLLYGIALVYGATGHTDFEGIRAASRTGDPLGHDRPRARSLVGFAFKVGAVPFHQWTPDVYEGAPTPVTAYMSVDGEGRRPSRRCSALLTQRVRRRVAAGLEPTPLGARGG